MSPHFEMVAVTYGEFQAWYNYGELRLRSDRLVPLGRDGDLPEPSHRHVQSLIERFPQLSLEDEEGVLLVQLVTSQYEAGIEPDTRVYPINGIKRLIPLTDRARRILETRMEGIKLERACLEKPVREAWFKMGVRRAWRGGDALVGLLFEDGLSCIGDPLKQAVEDGIWAIDHSDDEPGGGPADRDAGKTWVPNAYAFTRPGPYKKGGGEMDYLRDARAVLSECQKRQKTSEAPTTSEVQVRGDAPLAPLESVGKALAHEFGTTGRLVDILNYEGFAQAAKETRIGLEQAFPAELATLVLFLRWKALFHKQREKVDVEQLAEEIPDFVSAVGFDATVAAVWLIGCFAGYERIAPAVYAASSDTYRWYSGRGLNIERAKRPAFEKSSETAAPTSEVCPEEGAEAGKADPSPNQALPSGGDTPTSPTGQDQGTSRGDEAQEAEQQVATDYEGDKAPVTKSGASKRSRKRSTGKRNESRKGSSPPSTSNEAARGNHTELPLDAQKSEVSVGSQSGDGPATSLGGAVER